METLTDAMKATLGHLRLRGLRDTRFRGEDGQATGYIDVFPPGAVVGRSDEVDVVVLDDTEFVSRRHAFITPDGLHWVIRDERSSHGTRMQGPNKRLELLPRVRYPLTTGDEVILAGQAGFSIEVRVKSPSGVRTKQAPPPRQDEYLEDPALQEVAYLLLAPRRRVPGSAAVPTAEEIAGELHIAVPTVYARIDKLKSIDRIGRWLPVAKRHSLSLVADATAYAYPYLARPDADE